MFRMSTKWYEKRAHLQRVVLKVRKTVLVERPSETNGALSK